MISKGYVITLFSFLLFSCFNSNISQESESDFLAYYNTFYAAEKSFNEALEIIESSDNESFKISEQAILLLEQSIENALIIEKRFSETKYLDDSYYILGRASYLMDKVTVSSYYFKRLLTEFPESNFSSEAYIWLGYINLKIGNVIDAKKTLSLISQSSFSEKRLIYILAYEIFIYLDNYEEAEMNLLHAIEYSTKDQKLSIYKKLFKISENFNIGSNCIKYLDLIEQIISFENMDYELTIKWIEYNLIAENFNRVLDRLDKLISITIKKDYLAEYIIREAKINILLDNPIKAENTLINFINDNIDNRILKSKISEAYLILGELKLKYGFNILEGESNFQSSIEISSTSKYGKKAKIYIESIDDYLNLIEQVKYEKSIEGIEIEGNDINNEFLIPLPDDYSVNRNLDSLYFDLGRLLYFNLNSQDSAIVRFKKIVKEFSQSPYSYKSMIILDMAEPNNNWNDLIDMNSTSLLIFDSELSNEVELKRNEAWNVLSKSYSESMELFVQLSEEYQDDLALYAAGYISDYMFNDLGNAVSYYNDYLTKFSDSDKVVKVQSRLIEIKEILSNEIDNIKQRKNYRIANFWINNNINIDSTIYYLDNTSKIGLNRSLKSHSQSLISALKDYGTNLEIINRDTIDDEIDLDFLKLKIADFLYKEIDYDNLALDYYMNIIENSDNLNYVKTSMASLSYIKPSDKWDSLLFSKVKDSSEFLILLTNSLKSNKYKIMGSSISDSLDFLWYDDLYNTYFKETNPDSLEINLEPPNNENIKKEKR